jgi:hypothetical protein
MSPAFVDIEERVVVKTFWAVKLVKLVEVPIAPPIVIDPSVGFVPSRVRAKAPLMLLLVVISLAVHVLEAPNITGPVIESSPKGWTLLPRDLTLADPPVASIVRSKRSVLGTRLLLRVTPVSPLKITVSLIVVGPVIPSDPTDRMSPPKTREEPVRVTEPKGREELPSACISMGPDGENNPKVGFPLLEITAWDKVIPEDPVVFNVVFADIVIGVVIDMKEFV